MAKRLKEVLSRKVLRKARSDAKGIRAVESAWKAVVPKRFAGSTRVAAWKRRDLTVAVDGSPALSEIASFHRQELLSAVNGELTAAGFPTARAIRFILEEEVARGG